MRKKISKIFNEVHEYLRPVNVKKRLVSYWGYYNGKACIYSGRGFIQGMGVDVEADVFEIRRLNVSIIKDIHFSVNPEWMRDLKKRWKEDEEQQRIERERERQHTT